jgi:DNA end-binding protein Ku
VVQIRAAGRGMVLQQLLYAGEVRSFEDLDIEPSEIADAELDLAKQLIAQISADSYDPRAFVDEEKKRILDAVEKKIAGKQMRVPMPAPNAGSQVIDLLGALRASLRTDRSANGDANTSAPSLGQRKSAKRASHKASRVAGTSPKSRSSKR